MKLFLVPEPGDAPDERARIEAAVRAAVDPQPGRPQGFEAMADGLLGVVAARESATSHPLDVVLLDPLQVARWGALTARAKGGN